MKHIKPVKRHGNSVGVTLPKEEYSVGEHVDISGLKKVRVLTQIKEVDDDGKQIS